MSMSARLQPGPKKFLAHAGPFLYQKEDLHHLLLGLAHFLEQNPRHLTSSPLFFSLEKESQVIGAAMLMPDRQLILSETTSETLEFFANELHARDHRIHEMIAPLAQADAFAALYGKKLNVTPRRVLEQKIYVLKAVKAIMPAKGSMRPAAEVDVGLLRDWLWEFYRESAPREVLSLELAHSIARHVVNERQAFLWEDDGKVCSMAQSGRTSRNTVALRAIYTPKALRGNGYATALTAELSRLLLSRDRLRCLLYTERNNEVANRVYESIGFEFIGEAWQYSFTGEGL